MYSTKAKNWNQTRNQTILYQMIKLSLETLFQRGIEQQISIIRKISDSIKQSRHAIVVFALTLIRQLNLVFKRNNN